MARPLREQIPGGVYHVYARGNDRQLIFRDDVDCENYLAILARAVARSGWRCLAYCLMQNHVHLLLETPSANLGAGMQWLHGLYAQTHNRRHRRSGHRFQGRYGAVRITSDEQLWTVAAYIARNPVEARVCEREDEWPWGSHRATLDLCARPEWLDTDRLLEYFEAVGGEPRRRYAELVAKDP